MALGAQQVLEKSPATRNQARDHLIAACVYSQMLCQLSYSRYGLTGGQSPRPYSGIYTNFDAEQEVCMMELLTASLA